MSLGRRFAGAAMALAVAAGGLSVGPAARAQSSADCKEISPENPMKLTRLIPTYGATLDRAEAPIDVEVTHSKELLADNPTIKKITTRLVRCREGQVLPDPDQRSTSVPPANPLSLPEWRPIIPTNGPFAMEIIAVGNRNRPGDTDKTSRWVVPFFLAVPPNPPQGVTAQVEGSSVKISWSLRDQELDLVLYEVQRAAQGSGDYTTVSDGVVDASVASVKDTPGTGAWRYRVLAIRRGAGESEGIKSRPSADATAEVAAPTTTGGSTGSGTSGSTSGTGSGGSGSTSSTGISGRPGPGGTSTVNLSTYSANLAARRQTTRAGERDTGYTETLPFTPRAGQPADELGSEAGEGEEPQELGSDEPNQGLGQRLISDDGDRRRSLGFVAFGLLLFVLSMTGLFLKSEVKRADELDSLDPLPPEGGPPVPPVPPEDPGPAAPSMPRNDAAPTLEARPWAVAVAPVRAPEPRPEPLGGWQRQPDRPPDPQPEALPQALPLPLPAQAQSPQREPRASRRRQRAAAAPLVPPAPPTDPAGFATDLAVVGFDDLSEPAAAAAPHRRPRRTVAPSDAPSLDIPDPVAAPASGTTTRTRTPANARRTSPRVPPRSADDRRESGAAVRPRSRRPRQGY